MLKKDEHKIRMQKQKRERTTISRIKLTETLQRETLSIFNLLPNIAENKTLWPLFFALFIVI